MLDASALSGSERTSLNYIPAHAHLDHDNVAGTVRVTHLMRDMRERARSFGKRKHTPVF